MVKNEIVLLYPYSNARCPLPPIRATWSSFLGRQKQRIARMTVKSTIDYDNG